MKRDAKAGRELFAGSARQRKLPQRLEALLDRVDEARGDLFRRFSGERGPNFGGCFGQTEGERPANSFLPRSMIRAASKSFTRPSARSVSPLSMSAFSAANSWS